MTSLPKHPALRMTFIVHASSEARLDLAVLDDLTTRELLCFAAFAQGIAMETERRDSDARAVAITNRKILIPRSRRDREEDSDDKSDLVETIVLTINIKKY